MLGEQQLFKGQDVSRASSVLSQQGSMKGRDSPFTVNHCSITRTHPHSDIQVGVTDHVK